MLDSKSETAICLDDAEYIALRDFCTKEGMSFSEGVNFLIKEHLLEKSPNHKDAFLRNENEETIKRLESQLRVNRKLFDSVVQTNEKLEEQIAELRERVEHLYSENTKRNSEPFTDEQIAAITKQPVWKTRLWRHGQMKPRGERIKENLMPYYVDEGFWKKREQ